MDNSSFEKFYVYRSLHTDESWGAIVLDGESAEKLPNIGFGMKVFARNEKEAIAKAKLTYDKIHVYDNDKENVRRFAAAALKYFITTSLEEAIVAEKVMKYAIELNTQYNNHFKELEGNDERR